MTTDVETTALSKQETAEQDNTVSDRFLALANGSIQGILVHRNFELLFANPALATLFGYPSVAALASLPSILALFADHEHRRLGGYVDDRLAGRPVPTRYTLDGLTATGEQRRIDIAVQRIDWQGLPAIQGTLIDITDRHRTQQQFEALVDGSLQGISIHVDGTLLYVNRALAELLEYPHPDALVGQSIYTLFPPEDRAAMNTRANARLDPGASAKPPSPRYRFVALTRSGRRLHIDCLVSVVQWHGQVALQGAWIDVTEQIRSQQRFRTLVEGSLQGTYIHCDWQPLFVNQALVNIYGYDSIAQMMALPSLEVLFTPRERQRLRGYWQARQNGQEPPVNYLAESRRRDGTRLQLQHVVQRVQWQGIDAIQCSVIDVTEQVRTAQRFESLATGSIQGLMVHRDQRFLFVNDALARLLGYKNADALRRLPLDTIIPEHERERLRGYREQRLHGIETPTRYETALMTATGGTVDVAIMAQRIDWDGGPPAVQVAVVDVSQRKQAERALLAAQEAERSRIAYDLHDGVIGSLSSIKLDLHALQTAMQALPGDKRRVARQIENTLGTTLAELRHIVTQLHPPVLEHGLAAALRGLCQQFRGPMPNYRLHAEFAGYRRSWINDAYDSRLPYLSGGIK